MQCARYEKEGNDLVKMFTDVYLPRSEMLTMTGMIDAIEGINLGTIVAIGNFAKEVKENNLSHLLMGVHIPKGFNIFDYVKKIIV